MTIKKSLENRIRGWLPYEPYLTRTLVRQDCETKHLPPTIISPDYNLSATIHAGAYAVFFILLYGFLLFVSFNLAWYPISILQIVAWAIAGLAVGTITSAIYVTHQLRQLKQSYQISILDKVFALFAVSIIGSFIVVYFVDLHNEPVLNGSLIWVYAFGASIVAIRYILFYRYEKRENMRIMQKWVGSSYVIIPRAPSVEVQEIKYEGKKEI
jgi:hypothetical protein